MLQFGCNYIDINAGWILLVVYVITRQTFAGYSSIDPVTHIPRLIDRHYWLFRSLRKRLQLTRNYFRAFVKASLVGHYVPSCDTCIVQSTIMAKFRLETCKVCIWCA